MEVYMFVNIHDTSKTRIANGIYNLESMNMKHMRAETLTCIYN